jgi:hypothetical protein
MKRLNKRSKVLFKTPIKSWLWQLLYGLMLIFLSPLTMASDDFSSYLINTLDLGIMPDFSVGKNYLIEVFGRIPMVLEPVSGGPSPGGLLGWLIGYFNATMAMVAGGIISSSVIMGTIYTASEGKAMGKLSTAWVPLRSVIGVSFILPTITGFSVLQFLIVSVIVQGSAFADILWSYSSGYISQYGAISSNEVTDLFSGKSTGSVDNERNNKIISQSKEAAEVVSRLLKAKICYKFYQDSFKDKKIQDTLEIGKDKKNKRLVFPKLDDFNGVPSSEDWSYPENCGTFSAKSIVSYNALLYLSSMLDDNAKESWAKLKKCKDNNEGSCSLTQYKDGNKRPASDFLSNLSFSTTSNAMAEFISQSINAVKPDGQYFAMSWVYAGVMYYNWAFDAAKKSSSKHKQFDQFSYNNIQVEAAPALIKNDQTVGNSDVKLLFDYIDEMTVIVKEKLEEKRVASSPDKSGDKVFGTNNTWAQLHGNIDKYVGEGEGDKFKLSETLKKFVPTREIFPVIGGLKIQTPKSIKFPTKKPLSPDEQSKRWSDKGCVAGFSTFIISCGQGRAATSDDNDLLSQIGNAAKSAGWYAYYAFVPQTASEWLVDDIYSYTYFTARLWYTTFVKSPEELILNPIGKITAFSGQLLAYTVSFMFNAVLDVVNEGLAQARRSFNFAVTSATVGGLLNMVGSYLVDSGYNLLTMCFKPETEVSLAITCLIILIIFFPLLVFLIVGAILLAVGIVIKLAGTLATGVVAAFYYMMVEYALSQQFKYVSLILGVAAPIMTFVAGLLFYIPFIPLIYYTLAVIGWMILVIEAMIGVPLMLLGAVNPQGHDLLGTAQQSLMLILSVFLRPITIVIGFVFALIMASVSMMVLTSTMIPAISSFLGAFNTEINQLPGKSDLLFGIVIFMIMMFYMYVIKMILNLSFTLVYKIPMNTMKWLGMPAQPGDEEAVRQIEQAVDSAASSIGQGFSSMGGKMVQSSTQTGSRDPSQGSQK